jgi:hypothetical protein
MDFILSYLAVVLLLAIFILSTGLAIVWALFFLFNSISSNISHDVLDSEHNEH